MSVNNRSTEIDPRANKFWNLILKAGLSPWKKKLLRTHLSILIYWMSPTSLPQAEYSVWFTRTPFYSPFGWRWLQLNSNYTATGTNRGENPQKIGISAQRAKIFLDELRVTGEIVMITIKFFIPFRRVRNETKELVWHKVLHIQLTKPGINHRQAIYNITTKRD